MTHGLKNEFSTEVEIWLEVADMRLSVSQVGEDMLILRESHELTPVEPAKILLTIDGEERVFPVRLQSQSGRVVTFVHCTEETPSICDDEVPF